MVEIGSEFWDEALGGNGIYEVLPQNYNVYYTLSGRTALDIIIEDLIKDGKKHSVYMPSYCCHTMIEPFVKHNIDVHFYDIYVDENGLVADYNDNDCDIVYLIDYFGFICDRTVEFAKNEKINGKCIIYDMTHSLFCNLNIESFDYVFASFRKWVGVNAGFVSKKKKWIYFPELKQNSKYVEMRNKAFALKREYILEGKCIDKSLFLEKFDDAEALLEVDYENYEADESSIEKMSHIDIGALRKKRCKNAKTLIEGLNYLKGLDVIYKSVNDRECPMFVPILIKDERDGLRKFLCREKIYMPVHWPISSFHTSYINKNALYISELSCVCDQRYNEEDMKTIIRKIEEYIYSIF